MTKSALEESFIKYCEEKKFEINDNQIEIVKKLDKFRKYNKSLFSFLSKDYEKLCFYLHGGVGLGKTMILDFFFNFLKIPKKRMHFNEFMINFHDFRHKNKNNSINAFVKKLKKYDLIYLDELQVTNIVDAMILGKLFETIFSEKIKILITSNIKAENLYKDGLQREQFIPFIQIIKKNSIERELIINEDYRKLNAGSSQRIFFPLNEKKYI